MESVGRNFDFNIYYQRTLLHRIVKDKKYANQAIPILTEDVFDTEPLKWICNKIKNGHTTPRILISELKKVKDVIDPDLRKAISSDLKTFLGKPNEDESRYAIDQLIEFVETQNMVDAMKDATYKLEEGRNAREIREILYKAVFKIHNEDTEIDNYVSSQSARFNERERLAKENKLIYLSSGFKNIDNDIKGPLLGQFWSFFGDTNLGKSQAAVKAGVSNVIKNYRVLHIVVEDLLSMTLQRYDSSFTLTRYDDLTNNNLTDKDRKRIEKAFKILKTKRENHLRVVKIEEGSTMDKVYTVFKQLQAAEDFYPQLILIDSPFNMEPIHRKENARLSHTQIYKEIRQFCRKEEVAVIAFDQSNQESKGKRADTGAVSESYNKARIADGLITMNQNKLQKKNKIIELFTAKMKDRDKHKSYLQRTDFEYSRFISIERK